jgi:hypothetical protein
VCDDAERSERKCRQRNTTDSWRRNDKWSWQHQTTLFVDVRPIQSCLTFLDTTNCVQCGCERFWQQSMASSLSPSERCHSKAENILNHIMTAACKVASVVCYHNEDDLVLEWIRDNQELLIFQSSVVPICTTCFKNQRLYWWVCTVSRLWAVRVLMAMLRVFCEARTNLTVDFRAFSQLPSQRGARRLI